MFLCVFSLTSYLLVLNKCKWMAWQQQFLSYVFGYAFSSMDLVDFDKDLLWKKGNLVVLYQLKWEIKEKKNFYLCYWKLRWNTKEPWDPYISLLQINISVTVYKVWFLNMLVITLIKVRPYCTFNISFITTLFLYASSFSHLFYAASNLLMIDADNACIWTIYLTFKLSSACQLQMF